MSKRMRNAIILLRKGPSFRENFHGQTVNGLISRGLIRESKTGKLSLTAKGKKVRV